MQTALHALRVGRSPIDVGRPDPVAMFLSDIFFVVECRWPEDTDEDEDEEMDEEADGERRGREVPESERRYRDAWERVDGLVQVFVEVRDIERN